MLHGRRYFAVLAISLLTLECSCTTWKVQTKSPTDVLTVDKPQKVRSGFADKKEVVIYGPAIEGGNLVGWKRANLKGPRDLSYPLTQIESIEVRRIARGRTIALVTGVGAGVTMAVVALLATRTSGSTQQKPAATISSCPFVYSDTGKGWRLDSGTFGGALMRPLARTDVDNLDFVEPRNGILRLKVANELNETDHVDSIEVMAVDHESGTTVAPSPDGSIHTLGPLLAPTSARDFRGCDALASISSSDGQSWESRLAPRDSATSEFLRDGIELEFPMPPDTASARLVVDARNTPWSAFLLEQYIQAHGSGTANWYASMEANPERARQLQTLFAREAFLHLSVWNGRGWEDRGVFWEVGPEIGKRQVLPLDLAGISGPTLRVRLDAPPSFWLVDFVGIDFGKEHTYSSQRLTMLSAIDQKGRDRRQILISADGREEQLETGDAVELRFSAPPLLPRKARSYMLRSTGWYTIHAPEEGSPDLTLLSAASGPGGIARISALQMNAALESLKPTR